MEKEIKRTSSFVLFGRAFKNAKKDFWVSIQVLFWITIVLALLFWWEERKAQPDAYGGILGLLQSFVWSITRYIGDPGHFADVPPVTLTGRSVDTAIGILKILIFAVPAGLVANGFMKAINDEKHRIHLEDIRLRIRKAFRRTHSPFFHEYLETHPEFPNHSYFFSPRKVSIAKLEVRGIKKNDIMDAVNEFPEFRLKNMATAMSMEDQPEDRLVVEFFPMNTDYGCKIDRGSNITIVSTSSATEVGTGWFAYHLAKLGGFNYLSKEYDVDPEETDSFYGMPTKIKVNGMTKEELEEDAKANKEELELMKKKEARREQFKEDLLSLCKGENQWCIMLLKQIKNSTNPDDFHFAYCKRDGQDSTVIDMESFGKLFTELLSKLQEEFQLSAVLTKRYPLIPSNLAYKLGFREKGYNAFTIRISTDIICFDARTHAVMALMASVFNKFLTGQGMLPIDDTDFKRGRWGFDEINKYQK